MNPDTLRNISARLRSGDFQGAEQLVVNALESAPDNPELNAFGAFIALNDNRKQQAKQRARLAAKGGDRQARPTAQAANLLAKLRLFDEALSAAQSVAIEGVSDPVVLDQIAACFTACGQHHQAEQAYARLVNLFPAEMRCRFNLAAAQRYNGSLTKAAENFDRAASQGPQASEAAYARSLLKKATPEHNHLDDLAQRLARPGLDAMAVASLYYAQGKELEDLGRWQDAFDAWSNGATAIRSARAYDIQPEIQAMQVTADIWSSARKASETADITPAFIVSLPRAGSTLLDRILSAHPAVVSAGETEDFIVSLLEDEALAGTQNPVELARRSGKVDIDAVGDRYRTALKRRGFKSGVVIDKTPTNFLYAGLIAEALPEARIIHVDRDPMDAALATYKTLFRDRYFWSYDIENISLYITAEARLMAHWHKNWSGRMTRAKYEDLVSDTEAQAMRLTNWLGLDWDPACLDFTNSKAGVATASAEHVRRPIYSSSIGHWRNFRFQLGNLENNLLEKSTI